MKVYKCRKGSGNKFVQVGVMNNIKHVILFVPSKEKPIQMHNYWSDWYTVDEAGAFHSFEPKNLINEIFTKKDGLVGYLNNEDKVIYYDQYL